MGIEPTTRVQRVTGFEVPPVRKFAQLCASYYDLTPGENQGVSVGMNVTARSPK